MTEIYHLYLYFSLGLFSKIIKIISKHYQKNSKQTQLKDINQLQNQNIFILYFHFSHFNEICLCPFIFVLFISKY